jgi:dipicolinate synthase subunit A
VSLSSTAAEALVDADYALFPIPGIAQDGAIYAPDSKKPIIPDTALLAHLKPGATIILGWPDNRLRTAAAELGITLSEYEQDTELMLLRGPAIVEGALAQIIANTEITIHNADVLVVGHGNIGRLLARTLVLLGARVHLAARSATQRADALAAGCIPHALEEMREVAPHVQIVLSTVPVSVVGSDILKLLPPRSFVMDLSAPPGGIDLASARELGHRAVWARGLGRRAPVTVGASQWIGIIRRITEIEERKTNER